MVLRTRMPGYYFAKSRVKPCSLEENTSYKTKIGYWVVWGRKLILTAEAYSPLADSGGKQPRDGSGLNHSSLPTPLTPANSQGGSAQATGTKRHEPLSHLSPVSSSEAVQGRGLRTLNLGGRRGALKRALGGLVTCVKGVELEKRQHLTLFSLLFWVTPSTLPRSLYQARVVSVNC